MKNYEKYADEIRKYDANSFCSDFIKPNILKTEDCAGIGCEQCHMLQTIWLLEEYEEPKEPEVDWSKVEVDTPILVSDTNGEDWLKRHFAEYKFGVVCAWYGGRTSWTEDCITKWRFAKLAESEEE